MSAVPRRTVCDDIDCRFDNLSGSHHQSESSVGVITALVIDQGDSLIVARTDYTSPTYDTTSKFKPSVPNDFTYRQRCLFCFLGSRKSAY